MYRHIVVALDGSNNADFALEHAAELARLAGARLTLAHIINPVDMAIDFPQLVYQAAYADMAEKRATEIIDAAEKKVHEKGLTNIERYIGSSVASDNDDMVDALLRHAKQIDADMLVLGTHGRSGLMHVLMGSFAQTLLRHSDIPVLVVRGPEEKKADKASSRRPVL